MQIHLIGGTSMYNAVGIDVSKGKSTVAVLQPGGTIIRKPFNVDHTSSGLKELSNYILSLEGDTKAVLECTGRYHEPILRTLSEAGIFISAVNPHLDQEFRKQHDPESKIRSCRCKEDCQIHP